MGHRAWQRPYCCLMCDAHIVGGEGDCYHGTLAFILSSFIGSLASMNIASCMSLLTNRATLLCFFLFGSSGYCAAPNEFASIHQLTSSCPNQ